VVVVAGCGAHEDRLATELVGDDLEAEDPAVELGRDRSIANEQDRVVESGDGDAHPRSLRQRPIRCR
jgi:hypothetical protein